jgi:hypothetical protein
MRVVWEVTIVIRVEIVPRQYEKTTAPRTATMMAKIRSMCVTGRISPYPIVLPRKI